MKILREGIASLLITLAVWMLFSWPLPRYVREGIPSSAYNVERGNVRTMIAGDHLQFLYQFWLSLDTLKGNTPLFSNPYEFNTGRNADYRGWSKYRLPLSLVFALGAWLGGLAAGWNLTGFVSLWLTYWFTWALARRYTGDGRLAAAAALLSLILPYRWIPLFDGSPTGLAMMWAPLVFLGLDVMVAERKMWGGAVAGVGLCFSACCDAHVFFFSALAAPFWCLFSFLYHVRRWPSRADVCALAKASVVLLLFLFLVAFLAWHVQGIGNSVIAGRGRSLTEVGLYSPALSGVFRFHNPDNSRKIYLGAYLVTLLAAGWAAYVARRRSDPVARGQTVAVVLLSLGVIGMVFLAFGVHSHGVPKAWALLGKLIPPYAMIRQPDKIYCLLPVILSVMVGCLLPGLVRWASSRWRAAAALALLLPLVGDYKWRIHATICLLDREQRAYRAVAEDAAAEGANPHLIALPLWSGDSHFNSLNGYYVSLYHIRMLNGYASTVKKKYVEEVLRPFESMNMGEISDAQLDSLLARGIRYVVLHEDVFPEIVSPFPVGHTLHALLNHPRLRYLRQDGPVWAFRIEPASAAAAPRASAAFMKFYFSARRWEAEQSRVSEGVVLMEDILAMGGAYVSMGSTGACIRTEETMAPMSQPLQWWIRARGEGTFQVCSVVDGATNTPVAVDVNSSDWTWRRVPIQSHPGGHTLGSVIRLERGRVGVDALILGCGEWDSPHPGESLELPAVCFFHAGYTSPDFRNVVLRKDYEPDSIVFYGPKLPLDQGKYSLEIEFDSAASPGTSLGQFNVRQRDSDDQGWVPLTAGCRAVDEFQQTNNVPFFVAFEYYRTADMTIRQVRLTRLGDRDSVVRDGAEK